MSGPTLERLHGAPPGATDGREEVVMTLQELDARFRSLADFMPLLVWSNLPDGTLDFFNKRWTEYTGLPLEDSLGQGWQTVIHPDDLGPLLTHWRRSLETGEPFEREVRARRADGVWRWHLNRVTPFRGPDDRILRWFGSAMDIHDLKTSEAERRRLQAITAALSAAATPEDVGRTLFEMGAELFGACSADFYVAGAGVLERVATFGMPPGLRAEELDRIPLDAPSPVADVFRTGEALWLDSPGAIDRHYPHLADARRLLGAQAWVALALDVGSCRLGVVSLSFPEPRTFSAEERQFLLTVAALCAQALDRSRLLAREQAARKEAEAAANEKAEQQQRLETILDQMPVPVILVEPGKPYVAFANKAAIALWGEPPPRTTLPEEYERRFVYTDAEGRRVLFDQMPVVRAARGEVLSGLQLDGYSQQGPVTLIINSANLPSMGGSPGMVVVVFQDITRLKQIERELRKSEHAFRTMAESMPQIVWTAQPDGSVDYLNRLPTGGPDLNPGEPIRELLMKLVHPEDLPTTLERWTRALATGEPYEVEHRARFPGGTWRWMLVRAVPMRDPEGRVLRWFGTSTDIDDRKRAEERLQASEGELRRSERRFRSFVEATNNVYWITDANGEVQEDSPSWRAFTGQTLEEVRGSGWLDALHPEDRERVMRLWREALASRSRYEAEFRLRREDGSYVLTFARAVPVVGADGMVREWVGANIDITEQRRATQVLEFVSRASATLASSLDIRAGFEALARLSVPDFCDACGIFLQEEEGGPTELVAVEHVDPPAAEALRELVRSFPAPTASPYGYLRVLRTGRAELISVEDPGVREGLDRDPERLALVRRARLHSSLIVPILLGGRIQGAISFAMAGSGRRYGPGEALAAEELARRAAVSLENARLFQAIRRERDRVEAANRAKDEFLAVVSHELRTPLTAIRGWTSILRTHAVSPEKRARALEIIDRNARAQTQLIEDLLDVSRIISGKLRLEVRPTELVGVVEAALEAARPAAEAKGVRLEATLDPEAGLIAGDPDRLQQVVWNLLANAIKFTPRDGRVQVRLRQVESRIEIEVADTGQGIGPDFLPYVFERFRQQDSSVTRAHGGLGLGLAIVRHLVELHGGTVSVHSEGPGRGATFTVRLPLAAPRPEGVEPPRAAPLRASQPLAPSPPPELEARSVLVVEDEADARDMLATLFEGCRARVAVAGSVAEALERFDRAPPDVVISDLAMPGTDGYAFIQQVRRRPPERGGRVPALALTAYARAEDRARALRSGFDAHVPKPIEPDELVAQVAALLRRTR